MGKTREELDKLGRRILQSVRKELYLDMPYLAPAIGNLTDVMDVNTRTVGTDGQAVRFHPQFLFENYVERPGSLNRIYMHLLLHNLLLHPFVLQQDRELWDLACDITVESIVDSMDAPCLRMVTSDFRQEWYDRLHKSLRAFTAERVYRYFSEHPPEGMDWLRLAREFSPDDHRFWEQTAGHEEQEDALPEDVKLAPMSDLPLKEVWEQTAKAIATQVDMSGSDPTREAGRLSWSLLIRHTPHRDFRALLEKYMVRRETATVDPDAFDVAYYQYGMQRYGNMPLIEEQEGREETRLETIVIAIDTSASTKRRHVERFLSETVGLLRQRSYFFERVQLHILECDDRLQKDIVITRPEQIEDYARHFAVVGGYGTDYRPVFSHVRQLRSEGKLPRLRALLYFTDGYGTYPATVTDYDTAFVFVEEEDYDDTRVPPWAIKLYLGGRRTS